MNDCFRQAASMLVLCPKGEQQLILLLHKPRKRDAWQLPQGGIEAGETLEQAAKRELMEEAGITDIEIIGKSERVYEYKFPASYRRFRPDHICGQQIGFVFARVDADCVVQVDNAEVDRFVWVTREELPKYLKRKEYIGLVQHLVEEALQCL